MSTNLGKRGRFWTENSRNSEKKGSYLSHTVPDIISGQLIEEHLKKLFLPFIKLSIQEEKY